MNRNVERRGFVGRGLYVVATIGVSLGLSACGTDDPIGGWSLENTLYVCFGDEGELGLEHDPGDAIEPCCEYNEDGTFELDGHTGTWSVDGDVLTIEASDLARDGAGPYELMRDDALECF